MVTKREIELIELLRDLLYDRGPDGNGLASAKAAKLVADHDATQAARKEESCYWKLCNNLHTLIEQANHGPKHGWVTTKQIRECML